MLRDQEEEAEEGPLQSPWINWSNSSITRTLNAQCPRDPPLRLSQETCQNHRDRANHQKQKPIPPTDTRKAKSIRDRHRNHPRSRSNSSSQRQELLPTEIEYNQSQSHLHKHEPTQTRSRSKGFLNRISIRDLYVSQTEPNSSNRTRLAQKIRETTNL